MGTYNRPGPKSVIDDRVLDKLEQAFALGASDREACFYADIAPATLYNYQKENPEFVERKHLLKEKPILQARQTLAKAVEKDGALALKYLERKRRHEFAVQPQPTPPPANPVQVYNAVPVAAGDEREVNADDLPPAEDDGIDA